MSKFWDKFEDMMDSLPDYIEDKIENSSIQSSSSGTSVQVVNGMKIVTKSKNGKSVTTINGEEVVPKKYADELYETLESVIKKLEVNTLSMATSKRVSSAMKSYDKHKRSSK